MQRLKWKGRGEGGRRGGALDNTRGEIGVIILQDQKKDSGLKKKKKKETSRRIQSNRVGLIVIVSGFSLPDVAIEKFSPDVHENDFRTDMGKVQC